MSWTCADGTVIVGDVHGDPDAPLVILGHGGGQTRRSWARTAEQLGAGGFRAAAYDMRGHGDSGWAPEDGYAETRLIQDLEAIVAGLGAEGPILVGASAGGIAALAAAGSGRIRAAAVCLVDIAVRTERAGYDRIRSFMLAGLDGFASVRNAAEALADYRGQPLPADITGLRKALRQGTDGRWRWHWDPAFLSARHAEIDTREIRLARYAAALDCPVLLIRGGSSDVVSPEGARAFLDLCPHAGYADIEGAGHMLAGERNDRFSDALMSFLTGVRSGTARRRPRSNA